MTATLDDDGVFMRSLASRGHLGGLSPAAVRVIDALDAAGKDVILIETVGTGQSEIDVAEVADVRVLVTAPGLGDDIQAMKAGLLEIADILVVNKADREGAERAVQQLKGALSLRAHDRAQGAGAARPRPPPARASTRLADAIDELAAVRLAGDPRDRRRRRARYLIARAAADLIAERVKRGEPRRTRQARRRRADRAAARRRTPRGSSSKRDAARRAARRARRSRRLARRRAAACR